MSTVITYLIITAVLIVAELVYFKIADKFNIIDKPNQRSSHSRIVLRGGGIIFTIARGYGVYGVGFNIRGCWQV